MKKDTNIRDFHDFMDKGRFKTLLSEIKVKVILNPETALLGAAEVAKNSCSSIVGK